MEQDSRFNAFESDIGISFRNKDLLHQAMTHRSFLNENSEYSLDHNERLEFLGDAVLELVVTEYLYKDYPNPEGELTSFRAALVNSRSLAERAEKLGMNDVILLSRGEAKDTGRARQYILANAFEAFLGVLYLDQGYEAVQAFLIKHLLPLLPDIIETERHRDPKSHYQEIAQERYGITPTYKVLEEIGPDHEKSFVVGIYLNSKLIARGEGPSKQIAEEGAARSALEGKEEAG